MFGTFFCNYLERKGAITAEQRNIILNQLKKSALKLGFLAISEKMLTIVQAAEINALQAQQDKRFGELAIEKGYLTEKQLEKLLTLQGDPYFHFLQVVTEEEIMTEEEVEAKFYELRKDFGFSEKEFADLRSGDVEKLINMFISTGLSNYDAYISLAIRNVIRFIDRQIYISGISKTFEYEAKHLSYQRITGEHEMFLGLAAEGEELTAIAGPYAKDEFETTDADAYDAVCEFINCINGLFASNLSVNNVYVDMLPPGFGGDLRIEADNGFYVVTLYIRDKKVELIAAINSNLKID